jgi:membrane protein implicated in regulation of membrane protease activity
MWYNVGIGVEGMSLTWMIIFLVLLFIELVTVNLVSIWFAIGAFVAFLTTYITDCLTVQIITFIVVSSISLILTKKIVKKIKGDKVEATNLDRVIGKIGVVTEEITKLEPGEVKVDGKKWSAISTKKISEGSKVEILSIDGVKLNVKEIKEEK